MRFGVIGDAFVDGMIGPINALPQWGHDVPLDRGIEWLPGGSSVNVAMNLATLGHDVTWYGGVGNDEQGKILRKSMEEANVSFRGEIPLPSSSTGTCLVLIGPDDRAFLTHKGATAEYTIGNKDYDANVDADAEDTKMQLLDSLKTMDHVHIGGYYSCIGLHAGLPWLCEQLRRASTTVSLDPNGDDQQKWCSIHSMLECVDVFLPNEIEACAITQTSDVESAVEKLSQTYKVPISVVTCGENGAAVATTAANTINTSEETRSATGTACNASASQSHSFQKKYNALPIDKIVDTTGAGDAFDAGFLHGWKRTITDSACTNEDNNKEAIERGIHFGMKMGQFAVGQRGASDVRPKLADLE